MSLSLTLMFGEAILNLSLSSTATLAQLAGLVASRTGVPPAAQALTHDGRLLETGSLAGETLAALGVRDGDLLVLAPGEAQSPPPGAQAALERALATGPDGAAVDPSAFQAAVRANPGIVPDPDTRRLLLGSVEEMQRLLRGVHARKAAAASEERRRDALLAADPFDVEAQRSIEEAIAKEAIDSQYARTMEDAPELVVGSVVMLFVTVTVNNVALQALVDSGAQMTIMNAQEAARCGVMRLLDTRFAGVAQGVGTQKILGRILALQLKIGGGHFPCSVSVLETGPPFILGLDMLKRHQCCLDLRRGCLTLGSSGEAVPFLNESQMERGSFGRQDSQPESPRPAAASAPPAAGAAEPAAPAGVQKLVELGFPAAQAAQALAACGGDVEQAAALLFGSQF